MLGGGIMKRYIHESEDIFAMSKIVDKYAIPGIVELIGKFVYFSESNSSHGPRIKFYGGSKETSSSKNAPTLAFDVDGKCELLLADWMDKKNCPNAYDDEYVKNIEKFVKITKPILLLVWFGHLDEADALAYFHGNIEITQLFGDIDFDVPTDIMTLNDLDNFCRNHDLYKF